MTRAERYAQVKALRDEGLLLREIGERTGIARSTVADLLSDPTGEKARERKAKVHGFCVDCGSLTFNSGSPDVPKRCRECALAHSGEMEVRRNLSIKRIGCVKWTNDDLIALVRSVAVDGRISKPMWEAAREADPLMPSFNVAVRRFDTWANLCARAGVRTVGGTSGPYKNRISPEECLRWLQRCADDIGRVPPCYVYDKWHREHEGSPSQQTIRNRFGSWFAAAELVVAPNDVEVAV